MAFNSVETLNCSLTRYLEEASRTDADNGKGQFSGAMLSFLGLFHPNQRSPDYRNMEGLIEMLAEQRHDDFLAELRRPCIQCPTEADCPVGKIVLKK